MSNHVRSLLLAMRIFCNDNEAPRPAPPPPRFARCASSSGPPPPLSRGRKGEATRQRPRLMPGRSAIGESHLHSSPSPFAFFFLHQRRREAERRQTQVTNRRILRCGARSTERARLPAFHRGSHLRELFHPKGSASGQASWDAVCTGVTRLRLSQSRDAPPT